MSYQAQTPFNPQEHQWNPMQPNLSINEFHQQIVKDPLLETLHKHPHLIEVIFLKLEILVTRAVQQVLVGSGLIDQAMLTSDNLTGTPFGQQKANEISNVKKMLSETKNIGKVSLIPNPDNPAQQIPQTITSTLDVKSEHFFQVLLTDDHIQDVNAMNAANHHMAIQSGYAHANSQDPSQASAYMSPWGVSYQAPGAPQGQMAYQGHQQNPYGQQGYPQQPPQGLFNTKFFGGGLMGSLLSGAL